MAAKLTPGAIWKISTGKCADNDLKPVLQVTYIHSLNSFIEGTMVMLSDGSHRNGCFIANDIFISNKLHVGSIVQLTKFQLAHRRTSDGRVISAILCSDLTVIHSKCGIVGHPKLLLGNEAPLVERVTHTIPDEDHIANSQKPDHVDSLLNEDIDDDSHHVDHGDSFLNENIDDVGGPPTSIQNPSTSKQKRSSYSPTQNKKRKLQSSDDAISVFGTEISDVMKMIVEKTVEDGLGPCYRKLGTLEECVSKMTRMMMEKNKEDVVGFKKLETLEEDVSKMAKMLMEKHKEDVVGFKKLETLEEDVSKMAKMMMEKNKKDDMGACIEKLDKMGWGADEPIYDTALLLFLKGADYRKLWLHLKPECCQKWVKFAGSISGLLD